MMSGTLVGSSQKQARLEVGRAHNQPVTVPPPIHALLPLEARLLILSAQSRLDAASTARLRQTIEEGVVWARFFRIAHAHGVHPLVARTLLGCGADLMPSREQEVLRGWLHRTFGRNLQLIRGLGEILSSFKTTGIPAVCLKGPGLALRAYGGLEARACNDLDVIVPPGNLARASALLLDLGFERIFPHLTPEERAFFLRGFGHHETFLRQRDRLAVELHWSLGHEELGAASVSDLIWERCEQVGAEGVLLPVMPRVETVLYQARHAGQHWWNVLRHLCDFHETAQQLQPGDWETVVAEAKRSRHSAVLGVTALLVREYFGTAIPGPIERLFGLKGIDRAVHWQAGLASRCLAANLREGAWQRPPVLLGGMRQPGLIAWVRQLAPLLVAVSRPCIHERNWVWLPAPLWPLYYLIRPVRLGLKYGRRAF